MLSFEFDLDFLIVLFVSGADLSFLLPSFIDGDLCRVSKDYASFDRVSIHVYPSSIFINFDIDFFAYVLHSYVNLFDLLGVSKDQSEVINAFVGSKVC